MSSTQRPRDAKRERCACDGSPSGDRERAASGPSSCTRATAEGGMGGARTTGALLFGATALGRDGFPSGNTRDSSTLGAFGCTERRGGFSFGRIYRHSTVPSGSIVGCGRGASFGNAPEPNATGLGSLFGAGSRGAERSSLRVGSDRHRRAVDLRADGEHRPHGARQGRETLPSLDVRVGDADAGLAPRGETSSTETSGRRESAAASERVDPKPMGASSGAEPKGYVAATDSSVEQGPEVDGVKSAAW